ncbi:MAG: hypothetical protein IJA02_08130 [Clostridia bacterium]|nr:hypothetical protein [Clostridia bacterium]
MEKFKKLLPWLVSAALVVCVFHLFEKTDELESRIAANQSNLQSQISNMNYEINDIYSNVDEQLKKQASILTSAEMKIGGLDAETNTAKVSFNIIPKVITNGMRIFVTTDNEKTELTKNGNLFSGAVSVDAFIKENCYPSVSIETDGTVQTEYLEGNDLMNLWDEILPTLWGSYSVDGTRVNNGKAHIGTAYSIDFYKTDYAYMDKFYLVTEKNGNEISREDITNDVKASHTYNQGSYSSTIDKTYYVSKGDNICVYVVTVDSLGYTYKAPVLYWEELKTVHDNPIALPDSNYVKQIFDLNGELVYSDEEAKY